MTTGQAPNILLILTDQQRYDALGCNGASICKTPNLDTLAQSGVRFSRAYTPLPLCSPARASILTGLYPHRHGIFSNIHDFNSVFGDIRPGIITLPEILNRNGYICYYVGKWHLGRPRGFDEWYPDEAYSEYLKSKGIAWDIARDEVQRVEFGPDAPFCGTTKLNAEDTQTAWVANIILDILERHRNKKKPFFIVGSFFGPHFPYVVPTPYDSMYNPNDVPRWPNFDQPYAELRPILLKERHRWNVGHLTWPMWQRIIAHYWGYCTFIDHHIGRILSKLDELGLSEETTVVFTSDHGDMLGGHRLFNKGFAMYEETCHIPLLMRWPGRISPGYECDRFVSLIDLMPTFLEAAGVSPPDGLDGKSLFPLLRGGGNTAWREDIYVEFHGYEGSLYSQRMVRTEDWKYVYSPPDFDELYDMKSDPYELRNLINDPGCAHILRVMKDRMLAWMDATEDGIGKETAWQGNSFNLRMSKRFCRAYYSFVDAASKTSY